MKIPSDTLQAALDAARGGGAGDRVDRDTAAKARHAMMLAAEAARLGLYDEARMMIHNAVAVDESLRAEGLDLQARCYAQQGYYYRAEACWLDALALDPGNAAARKALESLADERRPGRVVGLLFKAFLIVMAIALLFTLVGEATDALRAGQNNLSDRIAAVDLRTHTLADSQKDLDRRLNDRASASADALKDVQAELAALRKDLAAADKARDFGEAEILHSLAGIEAYAEQRTRAEAKAAEARKITSAKTDQQRYIALAGEIDKARASLAAVDRRLGDIEKKLSATEKSLAAVEKAPAAAAAPLGKATAGIARDLAKIRDEIRRDLAANAAALEKLDKRLQAIEPSSRDVTTQPAP